MNNIDKPAEGDIWHPYWTWEEVDHNMWGTVENKKEILEDLEKDY